MASPLAGHVGWTPRKGTGTRDSIERTVGLPCCPAAE